MEWQRIRAAAEIDLQPVAGGFTAAQRGIVRVPDLGELFVKLAVDEQTQAWLDLEIRSYEWLGANNFEYAPKLLAKGSDGIALPNLASWDWQNRWTPQKLDAALRAMDSLAELPCDDSFSQGGFEGSIWESVPDTTLTYDHLVMTSESTRQAANALVADHELLMEYTDQALNEKPKKGDDMVHFDVRADNFAYNPATDQGLLVDWNWLSKGSKKFDQTAFLVDVHKVFDVTKQYRERLDLGSLAYLVVFFLEHAARTDTDVHTLRRRNFQLESALSAHRLYQALTS